jgi:hypothetical protein
MTPNPPSRDEHLRRAAAGQLADQLARGDALIARCQALADGQQADQIAALNTASRLILANARIAQALCQMAQIERRSRSITQRLLPPEPEKKELNSKTPKEIRAAINHKFMRFAVEQNRKKLSHPDNPHQEAHLLLCEEEGDDGLAWWTDDVGSI